MNLVISPKRVALTLALFVSSLSLAHVFSQCLKYLLDHDFQLGFERLLNLNNEANVPSWYSSVTLALCAGLLAAIGLDKRQRHSRYAAHWLVLAAIFIYLSLDEAAEIHEMGIAPLAPFHFTGYLRYSWVILGGLFVVVVGLSYLRFLAQLPAVTRRQFLVAGSLYVGGVLGVEMMGAHWHSLYGQANLGYAMIVAVEETFEMAGIGLFLYALCSYIEQNMKEIRLIFGSENP